MDIFKKTNEPGPLPLDSEFDPMGMSEYTANYS